jgi:ESX secretion system protein EccE
MTVRIALAALFIAPAAMAYPWPSTADRWLLGVAVVAVLVLFAWWRGLFFTTMVWRRLAIWSRRNRTNGLHHSPVDSTTVVLRIDPSEPVALPLRLIAGYLDRYGIRCDKVRITSRNTAHSRTTWLGLTVRAANNLAALRARSSRIPLRETAEVAARRLADYLRENGWNVALVDTAVPPADSSAKEAWIGMRAGSGYVAAYRVAVDDQLAETLAAVWAGPSSEIWTAMEITGTATDPGVAVVCTIRSEDKPGAAAPIQGLTLLRGRQRPAIDSLSLLSVKRLEAFPVPLSEDLLTSVYWPVETRNYHVHSLGPSG